jgi:hypothetical protein
MIVWRGRGCASHSDLAQRSSTIGSPVVIDEAYSWGFEKGMRATDAIKAPETPSWAPPPARPSLAAGEVHLWRATLDRPPAEIQALASLLSVDEATRAARFRAWRDRCRYVAARGLLRTILGRYLGAEPARLRFSYVCACGDPRCRPERRKPALAPDWGGAALRFNLSHADDLS